MPAAVVEKSDSIVAGCEESEEFPQANAVLPPSGKWPASAPVSLAACDRESVRPALLVLGSESAARDWPAGHLRQEAGRSDSEAPKRAVRRGRDRARPRSRAL